VRDSAACGVIGVEIHTVRVRKRLRASIRFAAFRGGVARIERRQRQLRHKSGEADDKKKREWPALS
jgi:hypothetical protein